MFLNLIQTAKTKPELAPSSPNLHIMPHEDFKPQQIQHAPAFIRDGFSMTPIFDNAGHESAITTTELSNSGTTYTVTSTNISVMLESLPKHRDDTFGNSKFLGYFHLWIPTFQAADNSTA
ncbi:hypothetical protein TNCV_3703651 [Trichonephila clavipes]|nr:hypothetical protein TNCV_3703651 [Trichonephila clavipes]